MKKRTTIEIEFESDTKAGTVRLNIEGEPGTWGLPFLSVLGMRQAVTDLYEKAERAMESAAAGR